MADEFLPAVNIVMNVVQVVALAYIYAKFRQDPPSSPPGTGNSLESATYTRKDGK